MVSYLRYPGYNGSAGTAQSPDFAILKFDRPLPGKDLTIAAPVVGEQITAVGFGYYGTPAANGGQSIYSLSSDGKRRAWDMTAIYDRFGFYPGYLVMPYQDYFYDNYRCNGQGAAADSGGPNFNQSGQLVALTVGGPTVVNVSGFTLSVPLAPYIDWIQTNTIVANPTLFVHGSGTNMVLSWGGAYTLQSSTNLSGGYAAVDGATSPYTNTFAGDAQRFFRLYAASNSPSVLLAAPAVQSKSKSQSNPIGVITDTNILNYLRTLPAVPL